MYVIDSSNKRQEAMRGKKKAFFVEGHATTFMNGVS
jgi:hypothetical protein